MVGIFIRYRGSNMKRSDVLDAANQLIHGDRAKDYGLDVGMMV